MDCDATIAALKPHVQKTPLNAKLLSKPPFRYLHDLVTELDNATGFARGLFSAEEKDAALIKEKDAKIAWLTKIIKLTELASGKPIQAKPAKIIAGLQPEDTNLWLQALGAIAGKVNTSSLVEQCGGERSAAPPTLPVESQSNQKETVPRAESKPNGDESVQIQASSIDSRVQGLKVEEDKVRNPVDSKESTKSSSGSKISPTKERVSSSKPKELSKLKPRTKDKEEVSPSKNSPSVSPDKTVAKSKERTSKVSRDDKSLPAKSSSSREKTSDSAQKKAKPEKTKSQDKLTEDVKEVEEKKPAHVLGSKNDIVLQSNTPVDLTSELSGKSNILDPHMNSQDQTESVQSTAPTTRAPVESEHTLVHTSERKHSTSHNTETTERTSSAKEKLSRSREALHASEMPPEDTSGLLRPALVSRRERPTTARKAPPRQKMVDQPVDIVKMQPNVIMESTGGGKDDDDESFVIVGGTEEAQAEAQKADMLRLGVGALSGEQQHGGLVRKILETERDLRKDPAVPVSPNENISGSVTSLQRPSTAQLGLSVKDKDKEAMRKEIDTLRSSIQMLTKCTNPLGKLVDYLYEDIDSMNKELGIWRAESVKYIKQIEASTKLATERVAPLDEQLRKIEAIIADQLTHIGEVKAKVLYNESTILGLIRDMVRPMR